MKPRVYVTRRLLPPAHEMLVDCCEVEVAEEELVPTKQEIIRGLKGKDGLLCLLTDTIDREVIEAEPRLRVISSMSVGYNHIDVEEATRRGIYVTYTPEVLTEATADFAWALIMASARRVVEADRYVREGKWRIAWSPTMLLGEDVHGKTLGIIGLGRIGSAVAKRARGFGMKILYYDGRRASPERERDLSASYAPLETVLGESDYVSIHVPLTAETHHMIEEKRLKAMKSNAFLINTSRGAVVDERALERALREKWIAGAAIDVWEKEPTPTHNPLLKLGNFVGAPHIASATFQARSKMSELAAKNLLAVLKGEMPPHLVNMKVLEVRPLSSVKLL